MILSNGGYPGYRKRLMEILQQMFEPKFASIDSKFAAIDSRFDAIDKRFTGIEKELVEIKGFQKTKLLRSSLNYK